MKTLFLLLLLLMAIAIPVSAADISGVWKVDGSVEDHPVTPTCTLKQAAGKVSGSCVFEEQKPSEVTGEVNANQITWKFTVEYEGTDYTLTFAGKLDADNTIKGTITVDPSDSGGDFTAKKQ